MKQEDKNLLLRDLCSRLLYKVKIETLDGPQEFDLKWLSINMCNITNPYLPYLYPLSNMTDVQREEYESLCIKVTSECADISGFFYTKDNYYDTVESIEWLNKNYFDYCNLIEKGLAIDATGKNIY